MDRALSIYFLLGWLGGDLLNLIGSFLAHQLPLQVPAELVGLGWLSGTLNCREEGCVLLNPTPETQTAPGCSLSSSWG